MQDHDQRPEPIPQDAVIGSWVDRAPAFLRPYLRLSRADRPIGTWLLFIPCIWGVTMAAQVSGGAGLWDIWLIVGCGIGAFLMRGAGCTWNDITDRDFDAQVERTRMRPLPAGQVTVKQAVMWMGLQCLIALIVLISFGWPAIVTGITSLIFVAIYPFAKRFTWWPQVFLGLAFNWGAWLGWVAHRGQIEWPAACLYIAGIFWTLFYDTIYAHQDTEDDALIGVKSTARLFGQHSRHWLMGFAMATVGMVLIPVFALYQGGALIAALLGVAGFGAHMMWQLRRFDPDNPHGLMLLFRSNRDAGLICGLFFAVALFL